ncbi:Ca2+:Cation Antiporter (CaCA) protein [Phytophthora megakarya]|uniref:Ca2+:Cation Antiporter (CaCA) protein n=1 Tax=Phytophthora megakarya TaxID=4795 RepID=A0A225WDA3_9STRA|nr:Ca2+:Cation Antiporter (CaCA) protein [Phytophthora megakarya]
MAKCSMLWLLLAATLSATVAEDVEYDCAGPSSTADNFIDYDHLVHCNPILQQSPILGKAALVLCLVLLLYLLSSTADEFFCPVLQAIVEKYRIPPHVAGVTFLSFGNGSPDVFSNIAAFATPMPTIGVTSILGGGLLVTTVITACVGLVSQGQEQLIPRTFLRDVVFYFIAVLYLGFVFFDGKVGLLEAVGFLCIYFVYVLVVFSDKYLAAWCFPSRIHTEDTIYAVLDDDEDLHYWSSSASEKSPAAGGIESEVEVEGECSEDEMKRKEEAAKAQAAEDEQLALEAEMAVSSIDRFKVITVFVRRLTIPLVDEDTWDKNLVVVCPPFAMLLFGVSVFSFSIEDPVFLMAVVVVGGTLSAIIEHTTSPLSPPEGWLLAPFICLAFVMSVIWIMNIANEVLAVLETLGNLFGISSSVLGVSVLAWGNSIGDLVSNMAIARDGFPTMAFAGCFAGPMFNLLIGIGLSLTIAIVSRGPLSIGEPSPLVYLGFGYLLLSLLLNIGIASYDGFQYRPRLCYALLSLYASFAVISIAVVLNYPEE